MPDSLKERLEKFLVAGEGEAYARAGQANQAIIGLPDDASWNQPERFVLYDEDQPGVHRTLMAQTRLGENSAAAIPLREIDRFDRGMTPGPEEAMRWYLRAVSLSRATVVRRLQKLGVPEGWKRSTLLRDCYALTLRPDGRWTEDAAVRLDHEVGVVYEAEETG